MLLAIDHTTRKVNFMSTLTCKPHSPRIVSAELYVRELISMFEHRFRKSLLPRIDALRSLLKVRLTGSTWDAKAELEPSSNKPKPLEKVDWFDEPLSPEHRKMVAESGQKAEATKKHPKPGATTSSPSVKAEAASSAKGARGSQLLVPPAVAPLPSRSQPDQAPTQETPPASRRPPQSDSEQQPSGEGYSIPCSSMDEQVTLQVWKDHLKPLTGIHGSGLAWHVVIPAAKSHLFFGEKGSQINQVVESCTPPAHITAKITRINGDEVLLIAIYAKAPPFGNTRNDESRMVDGLEVAMLQMFDAIYTWSTKIHGGEDLSFVDFMRSRKQRLIREAVNATLSTVAKAAHDLSMRTSQAMQDDVEQQERTKRRRLDG